MVKDRTPVIPAQAGIHVCMVKDRKLLCGLQALRFKGATLAGWPAALLEKQKK